MNVDLAFVEFFILFILIPFPASSQTMKRSRMQADNPVVGAQGSCLGESEWYPVQYRCPRCETRIGTMKPNHPDRRKGCNNKNHQLTINQKQDLKAIKEEENGGESINVTSSFFYQASVIANAGERAKRNRATPPPPPTTTTEPSPTEYLSVDSNIAPSPNRYNPRQELEELRERVAKQKNALSHLARDKNKLKEQLDEEKVKNKKVKKQLNKAKKQLREQKPMVKEREQIPSWDGANDSHEVGGKIFPMHVWELCVEGLMTRVSVPVFITLLRTFQTHFFPWMDEESFVIPSETTLNRYRAQAAIAAELVAAVQLAGAKTLHGGIDATAIETMEGNIDSLNLWMVVPATPATDQKPAREAEVVTLAAIRPQGDGTADGEVRGVEAMFEEAQAKVIHMNTLLTPTEKIKLVDGGCSISKIRTLINDTAHTAISTQMKLRDRVVETLQQRLGMDEWNKLLPQDRMVVCARCTHHLRNLLETESERHTDARLKKELGEAASNFEQGDRVELKFQSYIYALLKLFKRTSRDAYSKANTAGIRMFFAKEETIQRFANLMMASNLGRVVGSRQDCVFESGWKTFSLLEAVAAYCADGIVEAGDDTGQILRASILIRGSNCHFMAEHWFHALAWDLIFEPLRCIMGSKEYDQDYLSLAPLFDELYDLGEKLQTDPEYLIRKMKNKEEFIFNEKWKTPEVIIWLAKRKKKEGYNVATQEIIDGTSIQKVVRDKLIAYYYTDAGWSKENDSQAKKVQDASDAKKYMNECCSDLGKALLISLKRSCYPLLSKLDGVKCKKKM
jgi:hypothetical protein